MKKNPTKSDLYRAERKSGMTYEQIAKKYGVSRQRVGQACGVSRESSFRPHTSSSCVFVNLRDWLNENLVSRSELVRRTGREVGGVNSEVFRKYLTGRSDPPKRVIDQLISITGLTYEKLFEIG